MAQIIRPDFTENDYEKIVKEFLYSNTEVSLPKPMLEEAEAYLMQHATAFAELFKPYFEVHEIHKNARYDKMTAQMDSLAKTLSSEIAKADESFKRTLILFWSHIAELIAIDSSKIAVSYLTNSCNFFIHCLQELGATKTTKP